MRIRDLFRHFSLPCLAAALIFTQLASASARADCAEGRKKTTAELAGAAGVAAAFVNDLGAIGREAFCNRPAKFAEENVLGCNLGANSEELRLYQEACLPPGTFDHFSTEVELMRRGELIALFDRELLELQRLDPAIPAYRERWDGFQRRWEATLRTDPGARVDASPVLKAEMKTGFERNGLSARVARVPKWREQVQEAHRSIVEKMQLPPGLSLNAFNLVNSAVFLQALKQSGAAKSSPEQEARRNFIYEKYPEFMSNPRLIGKAVSLVKTRIDARPLAKKLFSGSEIENRMLANRENADVEGKAWFDAQGRDLAMLDTQMSVIGEAVSDALREPSPELLRQLELLDHDFLAASEEDRLIRSGNLRYYRRNPGELISKTQLMVSVAQSIDPRAGMKELQNISARFCQSAASDRKFEDWSQAILNGTSVVSQLSGVTGIVAYGGAAILVAAGAPVVAGAVGIGAAGLVAVSAVTSLAGSSYEVGRNLEKYVDAQEQFYSNLATLSEVKSARDNLTSAAAVDALGIAVIAFPIAKAGIASGARTFRSLAGAAGISPLRQGVLKALTVGEIGSNATMGGLVLLTQNWVGLGYMGSGLVIMGLQKGGAKIIVNGVKVLLKGPLPIP